MASRLRRALHPHRIDSTKFLRFLKFVRAFIAIDGFNHHEGCGFFTASELPSPKALFLYSIRKAPSMHMLHSALGSRCAHPYRFAMTGTLFFLVAMTLAGCGSAIDTGGRKAVTGDVTLDGVPIVEGSIRFEPQSGTTATGAMIADGKYEIPADKGLLPGSYRVYINALEPVEDNRSADDMMNNPGPPRKELIPAKYNKKSELTADVSESGPNKFDFLITR